MMRGVKEGLKGEEGFGEVYAKMALCAILDCNNK